MAGIAPDPSARGKSRSAKVRLISFLSRSKLVNTLTLYRPRYRELLATSGALWQYQSSVNLRRVLRETVSRHYRVYRNADKNNGWDKKTVPLYLFFFQGPERVNPVMPVPVSFITFPFGAFNCFNGEFGEKVDEIASCPMYSMCLWKMGHNMRHRGRESAQGCCISWFARMMGNLCRLLS